MSEFAVMGVISILGALLSHHLILEYIPVFITRKMYGRDQCKSGSSPIPEPMGIVTAGVWLTCLFIFIPFPFHSWTNEFEFPHAKFYSFLSGLLSISSAILLGFIDDVLDLRWRHKLLFPTLSTLPVLMVYYVSGSSTRMILPPILRSFSSMYLSLNLPPSLDIHALYYIYMGMLIVFCTNAINIFAGINGLEVGQAVVVAASVAIFNFIQLFRMETEVWYHSLSLYFLIPFLATSLVLYHFNKCPARVFVGDTYCYWAGMTLAVVAILGHFSKTMMLFLIPQVFNFLYSIPQLFSLVPCPRHRLPKYDPETNTIGMSFTEFKSASLGKLGAIVMRLFASLRILYTEDFEKDGERWTRVNNLTLINLVLYYKGQVEEAKLTHILLLMQVFFSFLAFTIRFGLAGLFYERVQ